MENKKPNSALTQVLISVAFILLFGVSYIWAVRALFVISPNLNGIGGILFSLICATPMAVSILVFNPRFIRNMKLYQRFIVSAGMFPLCIGLIIGWTLYEQRPINIFKVFVADPIPVGVSNIRARDMSVGIDSTIILAFNATPEAIDGIIETNHLVAAEDRKPDPEFEVFEGIEWNEGWETYNFDNGKIVMTMWINPGRDTVLFLWFDF